MSSANSLRQAALVLNNLSSQQVEQVVAHLDAGDIRSVFQAIESLDHVSTKQVFDALDQLARDSQKQVESKRRNSTETPLPALLSDADLHTPDQRLSPFFFLTTIAPELVTKIIVDEHPLDIALVLAQVPPDMAATQLRLIEPVLRVAVLKRLCQVEVIDKQRSNEIAYSLKIRIQKSLAHGSDRAAGVTAAARVLNFVDQATREQLLDQLDQADPDSARHIANGIFQFNDLAKLPDEHIKALMRYVDTSCWAPALKHASLELRKKILGNMASKPSRIVIHEMQNLGHIDKHIAQHSQQQVVNVFLRIADKQGMAAVVSKMAEVQ